MTDRSALRAGLEALGVRGGDTLLVHAAVRRTGAPPDLVLAALLELLGPHGTLVVPAFTAGNSDTSRTYRARTRGMTRRQRAAYRRHMPAFDPGSTPSEGMGALAEAVRRSPGAARSTHPQTSFAAVGRRAAELLAGHAEDCHLGERSPLARLYSAGAHVLLLGVGYDVCSAFHLAEYRAEDTPWREYSCAVLRDGERHWISYKDIELDDGDFAALGAAFEAEDAGRAGPVVRHGSLGGAGTRLFPLVTAVDFAGRWLAENRPHGVSEDPSQTAAPFLH
ncbi:AAC(3) family N-acetyltransferase [Streptomyces sp. NPDC091215]|uniref:aminoglycoside N(3)-acetyltransferase n=1 Tax=Streptomyces sp. NPDC091215 TaxID=3155192 RepID=UPI00342F97E2